jgi:hypothetical protein
MKTFSRSFLSFALALAATSLLLPLNIHAQWTTVPLGGGGFVTGLISNPTGSEIYCRTDVGGAFRWVAATGAWVSITDKIVPTSTPGASSPGGGGRAGIGSIAMDPSNSNTLYVALNSPSGIYVSTNKGATWSVINTSIGVDANHPFSRSFGERLAIDPNNPAIVWYGSVTQGLMKGVNSGGTWTWTQVSATSVPLGDAGTGVTFVACDKNNGNTIVYAGVYTGESTEGGIYRLSGSTWSKVPGVAFSNPVRGQVTSNGILYATGYGMVAKMARGGSLTSVTPQASINYRAVAVNPADATGNIVYVSEAAPGTSRIWRSTNGGTSWAMQGSNQFNNNLTIPASEPDGTPCLTGYWLGNTSSLLINPSNSNELWAADFFGVARTQNAQLMGGTTAGTQPIWYRLQKGQEETVLEVVKNAPTGHRLMVGYADVGGFYYDDLTARPYGKTGGSFYNPYSANTTSLDFCESNHATWARAWYGNAGNGTGAYSRDHGGSWLIFGQIAGSTLVGGPAAWATWDLTTYLATQKAKGATTVTLIVASDNMSNLSGSSESFDSKEATDSALRPKLVINGTTSIYPTADSTVIGTSWGVGTNYGGDKTLGISHAYTSSTANDRQIYLKFDLSGAASITSASLQMHRVTSPTSPSRPVGIFGCANTSWEESTITWNNRPLAYANGNATRNPFADPKYKTAAGAILQGGRIAVSSTNDSTMVWMPFGNSTVPHYSNDRGVSWLPCVGLPANVNRLAGKSNPSYEIQQLTADRVNGQFYITQLSSGGGSHTVFRSTNGGANWTAAGPIPAGTYNIYRTQIAAAPAANDVWFCDDGVTTRTNGGLWRSTNGGTSWTKTASLTAVRQVSFGKAASGSGYTVFMNGYKSGLQGVYQSDNLGATWTRLADVPTVNSIVSLAGDRQNYGKVFIGTGGRGLFGYLPTPPSIQTQPATRSAAQGSNSSFTIAASGSGTLTYQWRFNGANLPGATDATLILNNVQPAQDGSYTCLVSNTDGSVLSSAALLFVQQTFAQWAATKGLSGAGSGFGDDADVDALSNGLEFFLNLHPLAVPTASEQANALPHGGMETAGATRYLTLTYRQSARALTSSALLQVSPTLAPGSWENVTPDITEQLGPDPQTGDPRLHVKVAVGALEHHKFLRMQLLP